MKTIRNIIICVAIGAFFAACQDLDIPPKNILSKEDIYNEGGITAYMAGLYNRLPMEDFNMTDNGDRGGFYGWNAIKWTMTATGETVNGETAGECYTHQKGYWKPGYQIIRQANELIQDLPSYIGKLNGVEEWIAEAKFIRAYTYFALVKRYGGMPILEVPQEIGEDGSLFVKRNSHEESIDFILNDLDYAIANMTSKKATGRANKYVAAAFKSRVAIYAGSVARYGQQYNHQGKDGVLLCGLPSAKSNNYFQQAYEATLVVDGGGYALYEGNSDKSENFREVFSKADNSSESIFIRQYDVNDYVHSFDAIYSPPRMTSSYGDRYNPTLEWVELFDGLPIDPNTGYLKTTDINGNYIVYNDEKELYANVEARLRGSIMMPGNTYKNVKLDIRSGLLKENVDPSALIQKFTKDDGKTTYPWNNQTTWFNNNLETNSENPAAQSKRYETSTGVKLLINGQDGPASPGKQATITGFHGLKWINLNWTSGQTVLHKGTQSWIDIRFSEVLLNRAEAAVELAQNGVASLAGQDMLQDAFTCINKVRARAGAVALSSTADLSATPRNNERGTGLRSFVFAPSIGLHIIRVERYKELAFEHKIFWDLRRWFTFDTQIKEYRRRILSPYMFAKGATVDSETGNPQGKYIYDTRISDRASSAITFGTRNYYEKIPDVERKVNPLLEQNDQY